MALVEVSTGTFVQVNEAGIGGEEYMQDYGRSPALRPPEQPERYYVAASNSGNLAVLAAESQGE